jgi:hypothetical protein
VNTGEEKELVRFWSSDVAPPNASARLIMVVDEQVVRGQMIPAESFVAPGEGAVAGNSMSGVLMNPYALALMAGGAVGIVAIVAHNENDAPASP